MKAFKKFTGSSTHGFGTIRKTNQKDSSIYKYIFICDSGSILFDKITDNQIKGIELVLELTQYMLPE